MKEITFAIENGASEIDIVIDRSLVLTHNWKKLYDEVVEMRSACGNAAHLKAILGIGECGTMQNVYKASIVCMMAGADFIKTSTGKETVRNVKIHLESLSTEFWAFSILNKTKTALCTAMKVLLAESVVTKVYDKLIKFINFVQTCLIFDFLSNSRHHGFDCCSGDS